MIIVNFSHPLTELQRLRLGELTGTPEPMRVLDVLAQFDDQAPFAEQAAQLIAAVPLSTREWQTEPILVVPPALNFIAAAVLADLHGRMGYFPSIARVRPVPDTMPRIFEVAEIVDLQSIRERARLAR